MPEANEQALANANEGIPLFYLGGDPAFQSLARRLGAVHPFHSLGVHASVLRQMKNPYSLRSIAEHVARAIREKRPRGPYMLGGWRAHGVLALEAAQILREEEQDVALLVLLETVNPEKLRNRRRLVRLMARLQAKMNVGSVEYRFLRSLGEDHAKEYVSGRIGLKSGGTQSRRSGNSKRIRPMQSTPLEILYTAVGNYLPRPYDSPVLLIRSRRGIFGVSRDAYLGWDETLGKELEVCETDGNHYVMHAGTNVLALVHEVSARLRAAEQRWQNERRQSEQTA
jgi:thioesterase domain-containing protein